VAPLSVQTSHPLFLSSTPIGTPLPSFRHQSKNSQATWITIIDFYDNIANMHIQQALLLSIISTFVQAGPARRDCGVTKTFSAKNACGDDYGGYVTTSHPIHPSNPSTALGSNAQAA
jgi:hypothetical protein